MKSRFKGISITQVKSVNNSYAKNTTLLISTLRGYLCAVLALFMDVGVWSSKYMEERGGDRHADKSDLL